MEDGGGAYFEKIAHETGRRFEKLRRDNEAACQAFCQLQLDKLSVRACVRSRALPDWGSDATRRATLGWGRANERLRV